MRHRPIRSQFEPRRFPVVHPWSFVSETKNSINGIKTGSSYEMKIYMRSKDIAIPCAEDTAREMIGAMKQFAPWAATGFSDELSSRWRFDRAAFVAAVDQLRRDQGVCRRPRSCPRSVTESR